MHKRILALGARPSVEDYIYTYIYIVSLATPELLGLRSACFLSYKSPGSTGRITHLSLEINSECASGLYAGSSHIRPAKFRMDGQSTSNKPTLGYRQYHSPLAGVLRNTVEQVRSEW